MTETEWVTVNKPLDMINSLGNPYRLAYRRQIKLALLGTCRVLWNVLSTESKALVEAGELHVETGQRPGLKKLIAQISTCNRHADRAVITTSTVVRTRDPYLRQIERAASSLLYALNEFGWSGEWADFDLCNRIRDTIGNPFRSVTVRPEWCDPTVVQMARAAYEERKLPSGKLDALRLNILADALEDAGCSEPGILHHLRKPTLDHHRGCWVVDLCRGGIARQVK